jgi:hypothetical protein
LGDQTFDAYVVGKEDAPGIVVLQEWWGVDFEIKNHAVKISQLGPGFKALIPEYVPIDKSLSLSLALQMLVEFKGYIICSVCIEERSVWTLLKLSI